MGNLGVSFFVNRKRNLDLFVLELSDLLIGTDVLQRNLNLRISLREARERGR